MPEDDPTQRALARSRIRGVPHAIPGAGPADESVPIQMRSLGATRIVAVEHAGFLTADALAEGIAKLDAFLAKTGLVRKGMPMAILRDDPYEVMPNKRRYDIAVPAGGIAAVAAAEGDPKLLRLDGGEFLVARGEGGFDAIDHVLGFLFSVTLRQKGWSLSQPAIQIAWLAEPPREGGAAVPFEIRVPVHLGLRRGEGDANKIE